MRNIAALALIAVLASGCTHTLRITKAPVAPGELMRPNRPVKVEVTSAQSDPLAASVIQAIKADPAIVSDSQGTNSAPEYVVQLARTEKFKASGQNFFITFPGFIVFTHAWAGYKYKADITTESTLLDAGSNLVSQVKIHTPYEFRHCGFGRGATTSCIGWLTPGWGALNVIPGAVFATTYDKSATGPFMEKAAPSYGKFVSAKVLEQVGLVCTNAPPELPAPVPAPEPIVEKPGKVDRHFTTAQNGTRPDYAVYLVRPGGKDGISAQGHATQLSSSSRRILAQMSRTGSAPSQADLKTLLSDLGASPADFERHLGEARIYTQSGRELIALKSAKETAKASL